MREYEAKDFKGPSAIAVDSKGNIFFTDSGPMGESTLQAPLGSVYTISRDGQLLQPLALETLAHPCGLALSPNDSALYICEMMANRLMRFVQRPMGVWHCSTYYQFSGGLGPSAVACDAKGFVYVALYDFATVRNQGAAACATASPDMSSAASRVLGHTLPSLGPKPCHCATPLLVCRENCGPFARGYPCKAHRVPRFRTERNCSGSEGHDPLHHRGLYQQRLHGCHLSKRSMQHLSVHMTAENVPLACAQYCHVISTLVGMCAKSLSLRYVGRVVGLAHGYSLQCNFVIACGPVWLPDNTQDLRHRRQGD